MGVSSTTLHSDVLINGYRLDDLFYPIKHGCTVKVAEILSGVLLDLCLHTDSRVVVNNHPKLGMS